MAEWPKKKGRAAQKTLFLSFSLSLSLSFSFYPFFPSFSLLPLSSVLSLFLVLLRFLCLSFSSFFFFSASTPNDGGVGLRAGLRGRPQASYDALGIG